MKIQRNAAFFVGVIAVSFLFSLTAYSEPDSSGGSRQGNYRYLNPFAHKPATEQAHWDYARSLLDKGKTRAGRKQLEIFIKRWPASQDAPRAQKAIGDLYKLQGRNKKAFDAYEKLIQKYYTDVRHYGVILESQLAIAEAEKERIRMPWLFGGYTAPERAVPYLESIIRNAPQWERTPDLQYRIGEAYQNDKDYESAIAAYTTVEYRYPDSAVAEKSAFAKVESLRELVRSTPYSLEIRERAGLAVRLFKLSYPDSEYLAEVEAFGLALLNATARSTYETAEFYERVPQPAQSDAARIYYKKVIEQYGGTEYAALAADRLRVLFPGSVTADGELVRPEITPAAAVIAAAEGSALTPMVQADPNATNQPLPERLSDDPNAIELTADRMEYAGDVLIADGNVAFQQEGASLRARHLTVNQKTGELFASGNVVMLRENTLWEGQELTYNYQTRVGTFGESSIYFEPAYITAEDTERISADEFVMYNARITTCEGNDPLIYAKAKEIRILDEDKASGTLIHAKKVTFYVGKVPVFYTPVWKRHLGYRVFTYTLGYGGKIGAFVKGTASLRPTDWLNTNTHFDYYSSRGIGLGQDFFWELKQEHEVETTNGVETVLTTNGIGHIETYYINDSSPYENTDSPAEESLVDSTRYRVKIGHQYDINDETYFITKINYLSDPYVLEDFFREEFRRNANPENYAVVQHATDEYAAGLRADKRLNDFYTTVDRIPELDFDWYRAQLNDSPYYFESESSLGFLEKLHGDTDRIPRGGGTNNVSTNATFLPKMPDYSSLRLDSYNQVFMPFRVNDFYNIIPRAAYRGTWYSDTAAGSGELRHIIELGTLVSTKSYKTLTEEAGFYGEGLRHIVEPYADYNFRRTSIDPLELYQFDEIDELDDENRIRFGVRNLLQTHAGTNRISNVLDVDVFTSFRLDPQDDEEYFGPLEADLELRLTDRFSLSSDLEFDWYENEFRDFNARARYTTEDMSEYALSYRYRNGTRSLWTPSLRLFPNADWSYILYAQYDSMHREWQERQLIVQRKFDCVSMGVGVEIDEDAETTFWLQFWLNAYPTSSFGMGGGGGAGRR